ncbi:PilZ domain-containing protein [Pseudomonas delhiensis]|uniref:PilZ domain-containing protein n=1 Tax=Pseudomonas delhiensis TaxID=366289 RepID=A0A239MET3_9PSED|nr:MULTISPECIES: PilZ domain-containing protein [Pseudomonas]MED5607140.1 PilZ domain-containing protein [Pseudomonas sp. JH-2]PWU28569.1 PilZ domain-containing protein [Pseudomonas sp. RW407]SDJ06844.1 PilZ domain-containing protein [Pseudomonas delhiensis]SNT40299.1 PilZ domain-containing protein [Pseudomonas delhiensis]
MRQHNRIVFRSMFRIRVLDAGGKLLGYVADLSESGLKIRCDLLLAPDSLHDLRLRMRDREDRLREAEVKVRCVWSGENAQTGQYEAGLALEQPSVSFHALMAELRAGRRSATPG